MKIKRELFNKVNKLNKSILLLGPRQTGKSTLIRGLSPDFEVNLADQETFLQYATQPGLIKQTVKNHKTIFIDEVQRLPSLLNTVQAILDADKKKVFYMTGSSARKLKRGQANLLPGRILSYELGPLTPQELGEDLFAIPKALSRGLLPGIFLEPSEDIAHKTLTTYAATYLREEIQAEALTRNLEGFSRFFQIVASRSGDFIDFSKYSSTAMIERTTAKRYFDILVDTLVVEPIEAFTKSNKRRLIQHPRYYFFDVGVLNGCLGNFKASNDRIGNLFEHLFLQVLTSTAKAFDQNIRVSVYRTEAGAEVDFIIEKNNQLFAVEVKATKNIGKHDLRGLISFADFYKKPHHSLIVYLGENTLVLDHDIQALSLTEAINVIFQ